MIRRRGEFQVCTVSGKYLPRRELMSSGGGGWLVGSAYIEFYVPVGGSGLRIHSTACFGLSAE